jgi:ubiquinone/menaquinone biosynthesis C-methylase UbiE
MNKAMSTSMETPYRESTLAGVTGKTLEIGFGTGLNLPFYPPGVEAITAIDPNPGMRTIAGRNMATSRVKVDLRIESAESLPFEDNTFDSVVCTWTLCSIPDLPRALAEVNRVLKPGGRFFFVEHGLSNEEKIQRWQHRLTPLQRRMADGCHLDRNFREIISSVDWIVESMQEFYAEKAPKMFGYLYQGVVRKPGS